MQGNKIENEELEQHFTFCFPNTKYEEQKKELKKHVEEKRKTESLKSTNRKNQN